MTPAQLALTVRAHLDQHDQIALQTLASDVNTPVQDVAAIVHQLPEWHLVEATGTITRAAPPGWPTDVEGVPV